MTGIGIPLFLKSSGLLARIQLVAPMNKLILLLIVLSILLPTTPVRRQLFFPLILQNKVVGKRIGIDIPFPDKDKAKLVSSRTGANIATIGSLFWEPDPFRKYDISIPALIEVGIEPIMILHGAGIEYKMSENGELLPEYFAPYASFCKEAAARYPEIKYIQIWNEPDIPPDLAMARYYGGWGNNPEGFADLVNQCADSIHSVKEDAILLISLCYDEEWLKKFKAAGGLQKIDIIAAHEYAWYGQNYKEALTEKLDQIKRYKELSGLPVWLTEYNLLNKGTTYQYELDKAAWINSMEVMLSEVDVAMVYSWRSWWNGADIAGLPAETAFSTLAKKYNLDENK